MSKELISVEDLVIEDMPAVSVCAHGIPYAVVRFYGYMKPDKLVRIKDAPILKIHQKLTTAGYKLDFVYKYVNRRYRKQELAVEQFAAWRKAMSVTTPDKRQMRLL